MKQKINMLTDDISQTLLKLSLPIIGANFMQTVFGLVNMIWVGQLGSGAVSAIGTATFYINLATAISTLIIIGTGVRIAQSLGASREKEARTYVKNSLVLAVILSVLFCLVVALYAGKLIAFYQIKDLFIEQAAVAYLQHSLVGIPALFLITVITTILTSYGNTKATFIASGLGLLTNIILDPLLIFGWGMFPALGIIGAAWATNIARLITLFILVVLASKELRLSLSVPVQLKKMQEVLKMSWPVTMQRVFFIFISMYMAKIIVQFGVEAMAVQKIGVQIESISYITIGGLQGAIAAFIGQNIGAKKIERVSQAYTKSIHLILVFGALITTLFLLFPQQTYGIFIDETIVKNLGVGYMRAIGISQTFMCLELLTVGAFNGIGKTYIPPIVSIIFTAIRLPLALMLIPFLGINGVWWSISISSIIKGLLLYFWFKLTMKKQLQVKE